MRSPKPRGNLNWQKGTESEPDRQRKVYMGLARLEVGDTDGGATLLREGFDQWRRVAGKIHVGEWAALAAAALLSADRLEPARTFIADGLAVRAASEECQFDDELARLQGLLRELDGDLAAAKHDYERALAIATRQGAHIHALRAAMALSMMHGRNGMRQEALAVLEPVYARFTEGFDFPELIAATRVLEELRT